MTSSLQEDVILDLGLEGSVAAHPAEGGVEWGEVGPLRRRNSSVLAVCVRVCARVHTCAEG